MLMVEWIYKLIRNNNNEKEKWVYDNRGRVGAGHRGLDIFDGVYRFAGVATVAAGYAAGGGYVAGADGYK